MSLLRWLQCCGECLLCKCSLPSLRPQPHHCLHSCHIFISLYPSPPFPSSSFQSFPCILLLSSLFPSLSIFPFHSHKILISACVSLSLSLFNNLISCVYSYLCLFYCTLIFCLLHFVLFPLIHFSSSSLSLSNLLFTYLLRICCIPLPFSVSPLFCLFSCSLFDHSTCLNTQQLYQYFS